MQKGCAVLLLVFLLSINLLWSAEQPKAAMKMKPALLVIDIQNAYLPYMAEQDKKLGLEMINYVINLFRINGFPVIRVYHTDLQAGPEPGSEPFEFPKSVAIKDDDPKIIKNHGNAFKGTNLDKVLKEKGINTLFLCGLSAVGCVLATYHGAIDMDYQVMMVKDALISHDSNLTKAVQEICETINYSALKLLLENIPR